VTELETAEANYFAGWRSLVQGAKGGRLDESEAILFTSIPMPIAYFNSAFVKPPARVADHVNDIVEYFRALDLPFTVRYRGDDEDAASACEAQGLTSGGDSHPVMFGDAVTIAEGETRDVRIVDETSLAAYCATMSAGFELPEGVLDAILTPASLRDPSFVALLAYDGDEPVASSALVVSDRCAGVYNVATPPQQRKRGLGEAVTRAAVAEGVRRGCTTTTLQASAMGFPIYARMGYSTAVTWRNHTGDVGK
jgi:hypothetical protein